MTMFDQPLHQLKTYLPEVAEPDDFDEFWERVLDRARTSPAVIDVTSEDSGLTLVDTWDITFAGFDGHPIKAWLTRPAGSLEEALPAVVEYVGYGRGRGLPHERITFAAAGYAHLVMDVRGQGSRYGSGGSTPDPVGCDPAAPGFATRGILAPGDYYYTRLITDAVRAVDAVRALPGVDAGRVVALGNSQGGGLAVAVAGLVPDLAAVLSSAPLLCDVERALNLTDEHPYGEVVQYLAVHRDAVDAVLTTLSYVDGVLFARRATAPAHFGVGLRDTVCPPSTAFAAFNHYGLAHGDDRQARRHIEVYPFNHHEGGEAVHTRRQLTWLAQTLAEAGRGAPAVSAQAR
ncbi:acetylxylan esterase [Sanguibacter suarezii]|uniref:acetylxylan esterase n=1 Tax=Sanguibacter suarezii TaxID=60921 RepID=UPI0012FADE44|nr:acetylxylan esterase [Sanguibacter suarezii]